MILTLLLAVGCALLGRKIELKRKERDAVAAIIKIGGIVVYDNLDKKPAGPDWLRALLGENFFTEVVEVQLSRGNVNNDGLKN